MYPEVEHVQLLDTIIVQSSTCRLLRVQLYKYSLYRQCGLSKSISIT